MNDPVYMVATILKTGAMSKHGPYERQMITQWIQHKEDEMGSQFVSHKIVEE